MGRPDGPLGRPVRCGRWAAFQLDANYKQKIVKSRNFETLTILYMYIPLRTTNFFLKNVGYARKYPGTTVGPPMHAVSLPPCVRELLFAGGWNGGWWQSDRASRLAVTGEGMFGSSLRFY